MSNNEEAEFGQIRWGTAELEEGFQGIIREAKFVKGKEEYGGRVQLRIRIEPTSFETDEDHWLMNWYSYSAKKKSKWGVLNDQLEKLGCLPKDQPDELVGKEFLWERRDLDFSRGRGGREDEKFISEGALIPVKFIKDHKTAKKTTKASAPAEAAPPKRKAAEAAEEGEDIDTVIVEALRSAEGGSMVDEKLLDLLSKGHGIKRTAAFQAIKKLVRVGVVDLNADEGILVLKE